MALLVGCRGLPGGSSLARLLQAERGVRNPADLPRIQRWEILFWAGADFDRTGAWPTDQSGPIPDAPGETWSAVDSALQAGTRGLPGGDSLAKLLARRCRTCEAPPLTAEQILGWADAHHSKTGRWPTVALGRIDGASGETWSAVNAALEAGDRGLPRGGSLAELLAARRGVRNHMALPPFTIGQILAWADAHRARTGEWPSGKGDAIPEAAGETWRAVEAALFGGLRGLPGGDTLARLLARKRGKRNRKALPALSVEQIKRWADAHFQRTGHWPKQTDGPISDARGETWMAVHQALNKGRRGLPGGSSLARVVRECQARLK